MRITDFTVRFARKIAPKQYESADAEMTLVGCLVDGEEYTDAMGADLMTRARSIVLSSLRGTPQPAEGTPATVVVQPTKAAPAPAVAPTPAPVPAPAPAPAVNTDAADVPGDEAPKRGRGRPPKQAPIAVVIPKDEIPGDDDKPAAAPVAATKPADVADVPDTTVTAPATDGLTAPELSAALASYITGNKISAAQVKEILSTKFGGLTTTRQIEDPAVRKAFLGEVEAVINV